MRIYDVKTDKFGTIQLSRDSIAEARAWAKQALGAYRYSTRSNVTSFVNIECRKVLLVDPQDEVIPDMACLRSGVADEICRRQGKRVFGDEFLAKFVKSYHFLHKLIEIGFEEAEGAGS